MFTAKDVATLRTMTGAGMMSCKEALVETNGNIESAKDWLRKKGLQIVSKKAGRDTNAGLIGTYTYYDETGNATATILEVKCETDFVARNTDFHTFIVSALREGINAVSVSDVVAKIGENIQYGRSQTLTGGLVIGSYVHNKQFEDKTVKLGSIGVLVQVIGPVGDESVKLAHALAMHIAASRPKAITPDGLDSVFVEKERQLLLEQALESGKPAAIVEKMVVGRLQKVLRDSCLIYQPFVINPTQTVEQALTDANCEVLNFVRYEIGE
jgi:elongation factor Ts